MGNCNGNTKVLLQRRLTQAAVADGATPEELGEHVAVFDGRYHRAQVDESGNVHIYKTRRGRTTNDQLSDGIDDPRPSSLRERLKRVNQRNTAFWKERGGIPG